MPLDCQPARVPIARTRPARHASRRMPAARPGSASAWSRCAARPTPTTNLARAVDGIARGRRRGARRSSACPSSSARSTSARREDHALLRPRRADPGPDHRGARRASRSETGRGRRRLALRAARGRASTTTPPSSSTPTARSRGIYRKMHIPDDPLYYEKFYFTPGDLGFQAFDTAVGTRRHARLLGPVVPRGARASPPCAGAEVLFYPTAIGWHPARRPSTARPSTTPGRRCSAPTPSPTASSSRPSTASATKGRPTAASSSGAASFVADPFGRVLAEAGARRARRSWSSTCDPRAQEETRRNWPFLRDRRIDAYGADHAALPRRLTPPRRPPTRPPRSATACPPSGSRTRPPGSPGRTTATTGPASSRPIPWVYAEIVRHLAPGRARSASSSTTRDGGAPARPTLLDAPASTSSRVDFVRVADRPRLDARLRPDLRRQRRADGDASRWSTGSSTAGRSTTTTSATTRVPRRSPSALGAAALDAEADGRRPARRVVLEGGAHRRQRPGDAAHDRGVPARADVQARNPGLDRDGARAASSPTTSASAT